MKSKTTSAKPRAQKLNSMAVTKGEAAALRLLRKHLQPDCEETQIVLAGLFWHINKHQMTEALLLRSMEMRREGKAGDMVFPGA